MSKFFLAIFVFVTGVMLSFSSMAGSVRWANKVQATGPTGGSPSNAVGAPPNSLALEVRGSSQATFTDFIVEQVFDDSGFADFFGLATEELANADFIIFDYNGGNAGNIDVEDCKFTFNDKTFSSTITHLSQNPTATPGRITSGAVNDVVFNDELYLELFGVNFPAGVYDSVLILDIDDSIDVSSPDFSVLVEDIGVFNGIDIDAIGILVSGNRAPSADNVALEIPEDSPSMLFGFDMEILSQAVDPDGDSIIFELTGDSGVNGITPYLVDSWLYIDFYENYYGAFTVPFRVGDGELWSSEYQLSINIFPVNDRPFSISAELDTVKNRALIIELQGEDVDSTDLFFKLIDGPENGSVTAVGNGLVLYAPNKDFTGMDTFRYVANDGELDSFPSTVSIKVADSNTTDYLVFSREINASGDYAIFLGEIAVGQNGPELQNETRITNPDGAWSDIALSAGPGGASLLFRSDRAGNMDVYELFLGDGSIRRWTNTPNNEYHAEYSPDGLKILVDRRSGSVNGKTDVWVMDAADADGDGNGDNAVQLTVDGWNYNGKWSPDGSRIAFRTDRNISGGVNSQIFMMDTAGENETAVTGPGAWDTTLVWRSSGQELIIQRDSRFRAFDNGEYPDLWNINLESGEETNLTQTPATAEYYPALSGDEKYLVFSSYEEGPGLLPFDLGLMDLGSGERYALTQNPLDEIFPVWVSSELEMGQLRESVGLPETRFISLSVSGSGSVATAPDQAVFELGTEAVLTASPAEFWRFTGWSGDVESQENPLTVIMDTQKSITANFEEIPAYDYSITGTEGGTFTLDGEPLSGTGATGSVRQGQTLQLGAIPRAKYVFAGWAIGASPGSVVETPAGEMLELSGDILVADPEISITAMAPIRAEAQFELTLYDYLVFSREINASGDYAIFLGEIAVGENGPELQNETRITNPDGAWSDIALSAGPGGASLLFRSDRAGNMDVYELFLEDGSIRRWTNTPNNEYHAEYSPDGLKILVDRRSGSVNGKTDVWVMDAADGDGDGNGDNAVQLTVDGWNYNGKWSPDGSRIAFRTDRNISGGVNSQIFVMDTAGENETPLTGPGAWDTTLVWRSSGQELIIQRDSRFRAFDNGEYPDLWNINLESGEETNLTQTPATAEYYPALSGDEKYLVFSSYEEGPGLLPFDLGLMDLGSGERYALTQNPLDEIFPVWVSSELEMDEIRESVGLPETRFISLSVSGSGSVATAPDQAVFELGTEAVLTASPAEFWQFTGWSGDVESQENPLTVIMDTHKSITANFEEIPAYDYSITGTEGGTFTLDGEPVSGNAATGTVREGQTLQLTATPSAKYVFTGWAIGASPGSVVETPAGEMLELSGDILVKDPEISITAMAPIRAEAQFELTLYDYLVFSREINAAGDYAIFLGEIGVGENGPELQNETRITNPDGVPRLLGKLILR